VSDEEYGSYGEEGEEEMSLDEDEIAALEAEEKADQADMENLAHETA